MNIIRRLLQIIVDENQYIKENTRKYALLSEHEKMIIHYTVNDHEEEFVCRLLSLSAAELRDRKIIIYKKLQIINKSELRKFSIAFNLKDLKVDQSKY